MIGILALAGLLVSTLVASPVPAAAPQPGHKRSIDILNVTGSGCRPGTVTVAMSPDGEAFTVTFSNYLAQAGAGARAKDGLKDCRIKLRVNAVEGFSHTVASVDHRGFAVLAPGAAAEQFASYDFGGTGSALSSRRVFSGPYDGSWQTTDRPGPAAADYGPCGAARHLTIDTELRAATGASDPALASIIGMDSADGVLVDTYHLAWRSC